MKKHVIFALIAVLSLVGIICLSTIGSSSAKALSGSDFNPGRIIDDAVFYNSNSMSSTDIQNFLNAKVPNCDTNGTQSAADWGYPNITHAQLAEYKRNGTNGFTQDSGFHAPPYTCLRNYSQATPQMEAASGYCSAVSAGTRTGAQIIKDVATACGINPQVLIVLLNKEQSLVTDNWPLQRQYTQATGFACPDTALCSPEYSGFFYQVYFAARQFKVYQANQNSYNYLAGRTNRIYWQTNKGEFVNSSGNENDPSRNGYSSCGYSNVYIENQATAALYIYTPYRPNQTALNNLYGTGDGCSTYGNRNFWRTFRDWFGSTSGALPELNSRYQALGGASGALGYSTDEGYCNVDKTLCWQGFQYGFLIHNKSTGTWESKGAIRTRWAQLGYQNGPLGFPTGGELSNSTKTTWWQQYQNGFIVGSGPTGYWESMGAIRTRWAQLGYQDGKMGYPTGQVATSTDGKTKWQSYQNGAIISNSSTGTWESKGAIRTYWASTGYQDGTLGLPVGAELSNSTKTTWWQQYQNGFIVGSGPTGYWESMGAIRTRWAQLGYQDGKMGYPTGKITVSADGKSSSQPYKNGFIISNDAAGTWESKGAIREYWASTGYQNGPLGYPTGPEVYDKATATWSQTYQYGTITHRGTTTHTLTTN